MLWRERDGVRWLEAELPGARAAFAGRLGGVSEGAFASLNLGWQTDDDPAAVAGNRARLGAALGFAPEQLVAARQVHGASLVTHPAPTPPDPWAEDGPDGVPEADGHVVTREGVAACVLTADCLPVALAGPGGAAILHCGWRGLATDLIERGVEAVGARAAAVGPGIGPCCYEVGDEVLGRFRHLGPGVVRERRLDLRAVAERLLRRAGVERIEHADLCTSCHDELFFSHRRDRGRTGRQAAVVWRCRS
jgi:hypothetical protein